MPAKLLSEASPQEVGMVITLCLRAHMLATDEQSDVPVTVPHWMRKFASSSGEVDTSCPSGGSARAYDGDAAPPMPSATSMLASIYDAWLIGDTDDVVQVTALLYVQRATLGHGAHAGCRVSPHNWELLWLSSLLTAMKLHFDEAVFNIDLQRAFGGNYSLATIREAEVCPPSPPEDPVACFYTRPRSYRTAPAPPRPPFPPRSAHPLPRPSAARAGGVCAPRVGLGSACGEGGMERAGGRAAHDAQRAAALPTVPRRGAGTMERGLWRWRRRRRQRQRG